MHFHGAKHKKAEKAAGGTALAGMWKVPAPVVALIPPPGIPQVNAANLIIFYSLKCSKILFHIIFYILTNNLIYCEIPIVQLRPLKQAKQVN
jgi:hypothetical protein